MSKSFDEMWDEMEAFIEENPLPLEKYGFEKVRNVKHCHTYYKTWHIDEYTYIQIQLKEERMLFLNKLMGTYFEPTNTKIKDEEHLLQFWKVITGEDLKPVK